MAILSGSISLLLSASASSRSVLFAPLSSPSFPRILRTPPPMCLKQQHNNNKLKLLVTHESKISPKISLLSTEDDDDNNPCPIITISSGHGFGLPVAGCHELLLTCVDHPLEFQWDLALWNPSTKEVIKTLPRSSVPRPPSVVLEYAPLFGLGFDPKAASAATDYKVIRFVEFEFEDGSDSFDYLVELYSLKTDSWKRIAYPHTNTAHPVSRKSIYINGFYYWPAFAGSRSEDFVIISFDFANDRFPSAPIPGPYTYNKNVTDKPLRTLLVEFEGSLAVVFGFTPDKMGTGENGPFEFELWVWNNNDESWSRRVWAISIPGKSGSCVPRPLELVKNDKLYIQDSMYELVLFDCVKEKLKNLGLYGDRHDVMRMFPYVESLGEENK